MTTSFQVDNRPTAAFTLIELVAVIAIILILAGLLLPALSRARDRALRVAAQSEVKQIETAWCQYFNEYQTWPSSNAAAMPIVDGLAHLLEGDNPKGISFMTFTTVNTSGNPISPWGNKGSAGTADDYFYCQFDTDYDNIIIPFYTNAPIRRSVIVWTFDKNDGTNDPDYIIGSWQ